MKREQAKVTSGKRTVRASHGFSKAFTLVELLVVVSIIALLISILLPSLKKARDQAKQVKCLANLNGTAKGNATYSAEWNGWFLGSPVTTGAQLYPKGAIALPEEASNTPGDPVQVWDWAGPIAAQTTSLNWNRAERWKNLVEGQFRCPSNSFLAEPWNGEGGPVGEFRVQPAVSYNTMRAFMTYGSSGPQGATGLTFAQHFHPQIGGTEAPPSSYAPRIERVGTPSAKIFLADGARFTNENEITYDIRWSAAMGGGFSSEAPTAPDQFFRSYFRSLQEPRSAVYSYRHPNGSTLGLCAAYFDGHGEWMSESQSRWPNPWWPKNTVLPWVTELNHDSQVLTMKHVIKGKYYVRQ